MNVLKASKSSPK